MAAKNGKGGAPAQVQQVQQFVKGQLEEAQKRFAGLEEEAQRVLGNLLERGRESRKELEGLLAKFNAGELKLLENDAVKNWTQRAGQAGTEVRKRVEDLQTRMGEFQARVVEAAGVASQSQLKDLSRELHRLSKKVDALVGGGKKAAKAEVRPS